MPHWVRVHRTTTDSEKITIWQWETDCWKCDNATSVVWPRDSHLDSAIGAALAERDGLTVERVYSKTLEKEVWGNVCVHCDAYQGSHFVSDDQYL